LNLFFFNSFKKMSKIDTSFTYVPTLDGDSGLITGEMFNENNQTIVEQITANHSIYMYTHEPFHRPLTKTNTRRHRLTSHQHMRKMHTRSQW